MRDEARRRRIELAYLHRVEKASSRQVVLDPAAKIQRRRCGTLLCRPNDFAVKLRGRGPRAEADAARRSLHVSRRVAGGVPPPLS